MFLPQKQEFKKGTFKSHKILLKYQNIIFVRKNTVAILFDLLNPWSHYLSNGCVFSLLRLSLTLWKKKKKIAA